MKAKKKFFMDCHLAGRKYYDVDEVWDKLKVGTELRLELDTENRHDPNAVAVVYRDKSNEEDYYLGFIPRSVNETLAAFLEMGWDEAFECRISIIDEDAYSEQQIKLTIKIKRNITKS